MDSMASIYRFAASMAIESGMAPVYVNSCLRGPWDAFLEFPNGVMVGVLRQGLAMSRYAMRDRFWRMSGREGGPPTLTFVMVSDGMERKEAIKRLDEYPDLPSLAVCEFEVLDAERSGQSWTLPDHEGNDFMVSDLMNSIGNASGSGQDFSEYWRWHARDKRVSFDDEEEMFDESPSFVMTRSEKRLMDIIHDWPLSSRSHFMSMMDVSASCLTKIASTLGDMGLVETVRLGGRGIKRYALTDRGITYLCRRDRVEVKAKLNRMSVAPRADGDFRGGTVRTVVKELDHNDGLNYVLSRLWSDPPGGWERMMTIPTHRAKRRFTHNKDIQFVMPDAIVELVSEDGRVISAMIEYERRAKHASFMGKKIEPYRRYFDSGMAYEDSEGLPLVLFVFGTAEQETVFVRSVWRDMDRSGVRVPFLCATDELLQSQGPLEDVMARGLRQGRLQAGSPL